MPFYAEETLNKIASDTNWVSDYIEINPNQMEIGDIILTKVGCDKTIVSIGMITSGSDDISSSLANPGSKTIRFSYISRLNSGVKIVHNSQIYPAPDHFSSIWEPTRGYIYKVYREKKGLTDSSISSLSSNIHTWTLESAIDEMNEIYPILEKEEKINKVYSATSAKTFVQEMIKDGIFTQTQCVDIVGQKNLFDTRNSIKSIKQLLLLNCKADKDCNARNPSTSF
jgi:hypothetical protein